MTEFYDFFQALISRYDVWDFSLLSEMHFVEQNAGRICRAMFEIALRRGWAQAANACFVMSKCLCKRIWPFQTPIRYISGIPYYFLRILVKTFQGKE